MKNPFSDIDKALGVFDPVETAIQQNNIVVPKKVVKSNEDDIENDYKYQREISTDLWREVKMLLKYFRTCKRG